MKSNLTFSRWLLLLTMGLFLFGSTGNLFAQNDAAKQAEIEALHGSTVEVPQSDGRAVGDNCTTPIVVNIPADLPFADLGNTTCGRGNTYSDSDLGYYDNGEDIIYQLIVTAETELTITMDPKITTYSGLGLFTSCPTGPLGAGNFWISTGSSASPRVIEVTLTPGTYYLMADTWAPPNCIPVLDMTITAVLPPATVTAFPFIESFETTSTTVADWRQIQEVGAQSWSFMNGAEGGAITTAFDGTRNAAFVSNSSTGAKTKLVSPPLDLSTVPAPRLSFYLGQEEWFGDQNTTEVYYRVSETDPWVSLADYTNNISAWTMFDLVLPNPSATYQVAFEGYNDFARRNVIDLVTVYDAGVTPGIEILNANLDMGDRPIGAWMKPAAFEIVNNPGEGAFTITNADIDNNAGGFLQVVTPQLPFVLASGATTTEFGITNGEATAAEGAFNGTFAMFYGGARAVVTADYSGNAYTPVNGDVWEKAFNISSVNFPVTVAKGDFRDIYDLPGATADGWDVVYKIVVSANDMLADISLTGTDAKMAVYPANFGGVGGPDTDNALVSATTTVTGLELYKATYYLVVSTTGADFTLNYTPTVMPSPVAVTNLTPADGAVNVINGNKLTWSWGANTQQYRVVLGTTYPPATVVQDWATANTAANGSYTLSGLNPNLQYFWRIDTRNNNGTTNGDVWGFTTTITPPSALVATVNDPGESSATVSASLAWTGPTNRAFVGYNVYRGGVKITPTPINNASFTDLGLARNTSYSYTVKSVYDEGESAASNPANIVTKGVGTANGFVYDFLSNAPIEGAIVRVEGPEGSHSITTGANGAYSTLAYAGTYTITASASGYTNRVVDNVIVTHGATASNNFYLMETPLPVGDVVAFELSDDAVQISWDGSGPVPPDPITAWLSYDDGINIDAIGGPAVFSWAIKFDPIQLADYEGTSLTKVKLYNTTTAVNTLEIYEGTNAATLLYTQQLTGLTYDAWNEVTLTTPVVLDVTKELWITVYTTDGANYPAACGVGMGEPNGNLITLDGVTWDHLPDLSPTLDFTWNLRGFVTDAAGNRSQELGSYDRPIYKGNDAGSKLNVTGQINTSANAVLPKSIDPNSRAIVDYSVWRKKAYQPVAYELIGNTSQQSFVDFDWGIQDWGVYQWAVTVNYDAGQTSAATQSNTLDKNMEVLVDVAVTLNSSEEPGGTSVTFTNMSEPDLELVYNTVLDNSGVFVWDEFRRGVYDIEVMLPGYAVVTETGVEIFDDASFAWLLEELLSAPNNLYVTPTAYATWDLGGGGGGGAFTPFLENFDDVPTTPTGTLPDGWTKSPETTNWGAHNGTQAGGTANQMRFYWNPSGVNEYYLKTPVMSTAGQSSLELSFKHNIDDYTYGDPYTLRVVAIADGVEYIIHEWNDPSSLPSTTETYTLTAAHGVGATDFQIAWAFDGNPFDINNWYLDDVMLNGPRSNANRSLEYSKVFLDGQLVAETPDREYQYDVANLTPYETYTAGVAAVYSTGQSTTTEKDFIYVPCDDYDVPTAFAVAQVEGTLNAMLEWTNVDAAALDTISALRIYRDGVKHAQISFEDVVVDTYLDNDLDFGTYTYCITYIYDSGAETCQGVICDAVEVTGGGFVTGNVSQAAYLGGDAIEGAMLTLTSTTDNTISFSFSTNAAGNYEGEVLGNQTYDYEVEAAGYVTQTLPGIEILLNETVVQNFLMMEFPAPVEMVVAEEISDNQVKVSWRTPGTNLYEPFIEDFSNGLSEWTTSASNWAIAQSANAGGVAPELRFNWSPSGVGDFTITSPAVPLANTNNTLYLSFKHMVNDFSGGYSLKVITVADGVTHVVEDFSPTGNIAATTFSTVITNEHGLNAAEFKIGFVFSGDSFDINYWYIDDISLTNTRAVNTGREIPQSTLAGYNVYRTSCVDGGNLQFLGYTLDTLFNDNTWASVGSGMYKWAVEAVYAENESEARFSNCLDKDMITTVSVNVNTNSGDSPEGTNVLFTNTSEPDLELTYGTQLDETGYFAWDEFRKGTYDIYVEKNGFTPVEIADYLIDGPEAFVWMLEELLLPVSDLYVTPTGFATWRGGGVIPFEPFIESFDGLANGQIPEGWTKSPETAHWGAANTNDAGGTAPEMKFYYSPTFTGELALMTPSMSTIGQTGLTLSFNAYLWHYSSSYAYSVRVVAIADGVENVIEEWNPVTANIPEGLFTYDLTAAHGVGAADFQIAWIFDGNTFGIFNWNIDDVMLYTPGSRESQGYKVWLDGVHKADTPDTFYQYDVTTLVEGQEYYSEVAAMYSNGMSAKMDYTWTYYSCENYPGPDGLEAEVNGQDVTLNWSGTTPPPPPPGGDGIDEDFEGGATPTGWTVQQTNNSSSTGPTPSFWTVNNYISPDFSPFGTYHAGMWWDYSHQDEWLITPEFTCDAGASLNFWSAVYEGSTNGDHYYVKVSTDGGTTWTSIWDASALSGNAWNYYSSPYNVALTAYAGQDIKLAFQAVDGDGQGLWYVWFIDNVTVGSPTRTLTFDAASFVQHSNANASRDMHARDGNFAAIERDSNAAEKAISTGNTAAINGISKPLGSSRALLYDNGPLVNSAGTGAGGADESILQINLGHTSYGSNVSHTAGYHMADDFVVDAEWEVESLEFFGYQTGSSTTSTFTGGYFKIYDGAPNAGGTVIFGDMTTNRMISTSFTNIYRNDDGPGGSTNRPIMKVVCDATGLTLQPGTYWVEYALAGSLASGPWSSAITINGEAVTGNALQWTGSAWQALVDGSFPQGVPFLINGSAEGGGGPGGDFDPGLLLGANVYRDGILIAEMVTDDFYVDENVDYGTYTYCVHYVYESGAESCSESCVEVEVAFPCDAPKQLAGQYLWTEEAWGSMIEWNGPQDAISEWLFYDDGVNVDGIGGPATFTWAVKFDPAQLADLGGASLTKIMIYNRTSATDELRIYEGTNAATLLHSQPLSGLGLEVYEEVSLTSPVLLDVTKQLWIAVATTDGANYPAGASNYAGNPNSDLITQDGGATWEHLNTLGLPYSWNLRGFVTTVAGATAALPMEKPIDQISNTGERIAAIGKPGAQTFFPDATSGREGRELESFNVYRSLSNNNYQLVANVPFEEGVTAYSYFDTDTDAQVGYYYQVTAFYSYTNGTCESVPAMAQANPEDDFVYVFVTSTSEFNLNNTRVYPNPANNNVVIESAKMNRVTVMNALGQVVLDRAIEGQIRHDLNTSTYEAGVYLIRIETNEGVVTKRLTIVR